jgi:hypothetical protein
MTYKVRFAGFAKVATIRAAVLDCLEHFAAATFDRTNKTQHGRPATRKLVR